MKVKKGFILHEICGENIIVAEGKENIDFNAIISMNETAAYIWNNIFNKELDFKIFITFFSFTLKISKIYAIRNFILLVILP